MRTPLLSRFLLLTVAVVAHAQQPTPGLVSAVVDSQTIAVVINETVENVRLACISAPSDERAEKQSQESLRQKAAGKEGVLYFYGRDKNGNRIGELYVNADSVNIWMVKTGGSVADKMVCGNAAASEFPRFARAETARIEVQRTQANPTEATSPSGIAGSPSPTITESSTDPTLQRGTTSGSPIYTGPKGGQYRISTTGKKVYVPKSKR